jgi:hypothetical protein
MERASVESRPKGTFQAHLLDHQALYQILAWNSAFWYSSSSSMPLNTKEKQGGVLQTREGSNHEMLKVRMKSVQLV